jgi:Amt family ammonium transporter
VPLVLLGAGLLWFGWFGFNAGSALAASPIAGLAFVTTMLAPAGTLVVWTILDWIRLGKATAVGAGTAIVVGLVAITPAAGFISPMNGLILGMIAAVPSYIALIIRAKTSLDDSLDVVAAHGVGGTVGAAGCFSFQASKNLNSGGFHSFSPDNCFQMRQGSRKASERRRFACSSCGNTFFTGSYSSLRSRNNAVFAAWQAMCA